MSFLHEASEGVEVKKPIPGKASWVVGPNGLGTILVDAYDAPALLQSLRQRLKVCAWADGLEPSDLRQAHRACVLGIELAETCLAGAPRLSWLSREDLDLLATLCDPGARCVFDAVLQLRTRVRSAGEAGPVEADRMAKSVADLFTC